MLLNEIGTTSLDPYLVFVIISFVDLPLSVSGSQPISVKPITKFNEVGPPSGMFHVTDFPDIGNLGAVWFTAKIVKIYKLYDNK